ncbi:MAG: fimbrillin family protein [Bacteroidales bacterium]|nr:fimbrillin family protein [Bacteroidales bacterium]
MRKMIFLAVMLVAAAVSGCSKRDGFQEYTGVKTVSFIADDFIVNDGLTRTVITNNDQSFQWAANDTVGIYPNKGSQLFFEMTSGAGTNSAVFDGGGWAFRSGSSYYSYYPFIADYHLDRKHIPVSFTGQRQNGPSDFGHFGKYDYMAADKATVQDNAISLNYHHLGSILRFNAKLAPGTYRQLTVTAPSAGFVLDGHYNLEEQTPVITGDAKSRELSVVLDDFTIEQESQVYIYLMCAPVDFSGCSLVVSILDNDKKQYDCVKNIPASYPFKAGNLYPFGCSTWTEVPQSVGIVIDDWGDGGHISGGAE